MTRKERMFRPPIRGMSAFSLYADVVGILLNDVGTSVRTPSVISYGYFRVLSVTASTNERRRKAFCAAVGPSIAKMHKTDRLCRFDDTFHAIEAAVSRAMERSYGKFVQRTPHEDVYFGEA